MKRTPAIVIPVVASAAILAALPASAESDYKFGGYIKSVVIMSDYSDGDLAPASLGRDFYVPSAIPIGGESEDMDTDFTAKESRINFASTHDIDGHAIKTFLEIDFQAAMQGNEVVSNSYNPRLRHAFLTYDKWLFGQTWSTFQNVSALPEVMDFIGPTESTVFVRQAQIRYTNGPWQFAIENPETTVAGVGVTDDALVPDIVLRYGMKYGKSEIVFAGLARQLSYDDVATTVDESETGFGLSVSGKHVFDGGDDIRWMVNAGSGIGRYVGLGFSPDAYLTADGLESQDLTSAFVAYRHLWNDKWRSSFVVGATEIDNDLAVTGTTANSAAQSAHVTLMYSPVPNLTFGGELMMATREIESGADGDMTRFIFGAKYAF